MILHLIISVATGLVSALISALLGSDILTVALWYVCGCWGGFLSSVIAILITQALLSPTRPDLLSLRR